MEILYIYFPNYRNLIKQGVNLSSEFNFKTETEADQVVITITRNEDYIKNFFHDERIMNVSAIIGQNGTGKSNILDFIKTELPVGQGGIRVPCIVALRSQERNGFHLYVSNKLNAKINDRTGFFKITFFSVRESPIAKRESDSFDEFDVLSDTSIVYYSNHLDLRYSSSLIPNDIKTENPRSVADEFNNISTLAMLAKDQREYRDQNYTIVDKSEVDKVDAYKAREIGRNVDFISNSRHDNLLGFNLPEYLILTILTEDEKQIENYKGNSNPLFPYLSRFQADFDSNNDGGQLFINLLCRAILFNFYRNSLTINDFPFPSSYLESLASNSFQEFFTKFFSLVAENGIRVEDNLAKNILQVVNYLYETLIRNRDWYFTTENNIGAIRLPLNQGSRAEVRTFISHYVRSKRYGDYLTFQWRGLSTGEQSMITLLSRFYTLSDDLAPRNLRLKKNLIVLIDEGDVYFHPEWQRKYLSLLLAFLSNIYGNRTIHLILTSNTPYLASDLPKSYMTFLRKDKERGTVILNPENNRKETFASNIHTLLANSFYLENGLIGDFATSRINSIIDFIKDGKVESEEYYEYKKTIDLIGEPVIKNRIKELWIQRFGKMEEIEFLRKRIEELNAQPNRPADDKDK